MHPIQTQAQSGTKPVIRWMIVMAMIPTVGPANILGQKRIMWNQKYFLQLNPLLVIMTIGWDLMTMIHSKTLRRGKKHLTLLKKNYDQVF